MSTLSQFIYKLMTTLRLLHASCGGSTMTYFHDRTEAGEKLAFAISDRIHQQPELANAPWCVLALPRGGLAVAAPIARQLQAPLGVLIAKKITLETNPELAIGAVTADGQVIWSGGKGYHARQSEAEWTTYDRALQQAQTQAQTQWQDFAPYCGEIQIASANVLLVDDGIATGMTIAAAVKSVRSQHPNQVWICSPVAPPDLIPFLEKISDRLFILGTPSPFYSVSRFYAEFDQVSTEAAIEELQRTNSQLTN